MSVVERVKNYKVFVWLRTNNMAICFKHIRYERPFDAYIYFFNKNVSYLYNREYDWVSIVRLF